MRPQRVRGRLAGQTNVADVLILDGLIRGVEPASRTAQADLGGDTCLLAEPFLDIQVNGFGGVDFNRPTLAADELRRAMLAMRRTGVGRFLPAVITAPLPGMAGALRAIAAAREADAELAYAIPGIHLEGPFLAPEDGPRGAHPAASILDPDWDVFRRLQDASRGLICLVTLAPERPGAIELIRRLRQAGIIVGIGHTNATEQDINHAVEAGARISTHLGNGAHATLPRHKNYIQKQLATDALLASLICDGHHLPDYVVKNMLRCKGPERIVLVSDAMAAAAAPPGSYRIGEVLAEVAPDGSVRLPGTPYLAGSALTMDRAVENCARFGGLPLDDAVRMASRRPRQLLGEAGAGLEPGAPADLVVLRPGPPLVVAATIVRGEVAYDAECGMRNSRRAGLRRAVSSPVAFYGARMDAISQYHAAVTAMLQKIADTQRESIRKAAARLADAIADDRYIYVIGTGGHSYIAAEEMFWRAGGLVPVYPILDPGLSLSHGAWRSNLIERTPGYIPPILKYHGVGRGDVLIVCNAYGINAATIDAASEGKRLGATVIGVTSTEFATRTPADHPSRHPSRQNLHEVADIFLNTWLPYGDAIVEIAGVAQKVAPASSLGTAFVLNCLVAATVEELAGRGIEPPVWMSANLPGGDDANRKHFDKHLRRVKFL